MGERRMNMHNSHRKNIGALLQAVVAAGVFFAGTGVAFGQDIAVCIKTNGFKRTDVMNFSSSMKGCIEGARNVQPGTWSSLNAGYLSQIGAQDKLDDQQRKQKGGMTVQNCQSNGQAYDYLLADIAQKAKFYGCQLPASS